MSSDPVGVAVVGTYGTGKSAVVEEMAGILEAAQMSFAALDLDYLWWFEADGIDDAAYKDMLWENLAAVVGNYRRIGVKRFLMAWAAQDASDLAALRQTLSMPLHVVSLTVPIVPLSANFDGS